MQHSFWVVVRWCGSTILKGKEIFLRQSSRMSSYFLFFLEVLGIKKRMSSMIFIRRRECPFTEYEEKFRDLSRYALEGCRTETTLASKFQKGLLLGYARLIATLGLETVGKIVEAARAIEYVDERHLDETFKRSRTRGPVIIHQSRGQSSQSRQRHGSSSGRRR